jgi:pyrimidine operon attenuation protein/uracil phosphoribosyltransferase
MKARAHLKQAMDSSAIGNALAQVADAIARENQDRHQLVLVGIQTGGVKLAMDLASRLEAMWKHPVPVGELDICMHRDDLDQHLAPNVHPTVIPGDITGKTLLLVDDVLCSGRTIRAALDALHDMGRPRRIQLAVLVDRGHRELPIKADFIGATLATAPGDRVHVEFDPATKGFRVMLEAAR